ncbi:MAG: hypothetical protein ABI183_25710 [Polyangiaceae bacterium]
MIALAALTVGIPLSILVACGSSTFTSDDQDAQTVNPQNDAGGSDSQTTASDASAEASPPPTWCQTNAAGAYFCADFDEGDLTKAYVKGVLESVMTMQLDGGSAGDLIRLGDGGSSPPSSLLTFTPEITVSGTEEFAAVRAPLADAPGVQSFQLDFDLRLEIVGDLQSLGPTLTLADLTQPGTTNYYALSANTDTSFQNSSLINVRCGGRPTVGVWTHFRFVISPGGGTLVSEGSDAPLDGGPSKVLTTTTLPTLIIGQDELGLPLPAGNAQISFDNVVLATIYPDAGDGG